LTPGSEARFTDATVAGRTTWRNPMTDVRRVIPLLVFATPVAGGPVDYGAG
jgi:hypothetical protein